MSDIVANAVGTERQFSGSPQSTYQKRLTGVSMTMPTATGMDLANALGVLGNTLQTEAVEAEKRQEKVGIAAAERIVAGATEEDLKKLNTIELIGNYGGNVALQDNPYAIAKIEKMRGQYFAAQFRDEYAASRAQQPKAKTAQEEAQRLDLAAQEFRSGVIGTSLNQQAFDRGFNEKNLANRLEFVGQQRTEQALELRAIQKGSMRAALGELMSQYNTLSSEDFTKGMNNILADGRISWMSIPERIEFVSDGLKSIAGTGDYERIKKVASDVVVGVDRSGKSIKIGDVVDLEPYKRLAEQRTTNMFGEQVQKGLEALQKMPIPEQNAQFATWQKENPEWFNVMTPFRDNVYRYRLALDHKEQVAYAKQRASAAANTMIDSSLTQQLTAHLAGQMTDAGGNIVAASKGDLPTFEVSDMDDQGNLVKKKVTADDTRITAAVRNELLYISSSQNMSEDEKTARSMQVLLWGPASAFRNSMKMTINNAMDALTVSKMATSEKGEVELPPSVQRALDMSRVNPEAFHNVVGDETYQKVEVIKHLAQGLNGDWKQAVALYALGRENAKDKEFVRVADQNLAQPLSVTTLDGFKDLDGNLVKVNVSLGTNRPIMQRVEAIAKQLVYAGKSPYEAINMAKESVQQTMYVWGDTAMPKQIFAGVNTSRKTEIGKRVLEDYMNEFLQNTGVERQYVVVSYLPDENSLVFQGGGGYMKRTANDIAYSGNLYLTNQGQPKSVTPSVSADEVNKMRSANSAVNPDNGANLSSESATTLP